MNGENRQLLTDELAEFERSTVEVHEFWKITDHFSRIYGIYLDSTKKRKNRKDHNM